MLLLLLLLSAVDVSAIVFECNLIAGSVTDKLPVENRKKNIVNIYGVSASEVIRSKWGKNDLLRSTLRSLFRYFQTTISFLGPKRSKIDRQSKIQALFFGLP